MSEGRTNLTRECVEVLFSRLEINMAQINNYQDNNKIYKTVILPVILYGCETQTLTLREEKRLQVFENKVLRKIFGPKRDNQTGEWRRLHNRELHNLYGKPDIIRIVKSRRLRLAEHVTRMGNERGAWKLLVGKPEGKRPVGRQRMRWENNINHDLREVD